MQKRVTSSRRRKLWGSCVCVLCQILFSPHIHAPILPDKLQKITKRFQCGYKTKTKLKHITHYAIFQNRRICSDRTAIWLCSLCGLCILPYMHGLRSALVGVAHYAVYVFLACMGV